MRSNTPAETGAITVAAREALAEIRQALQSWHSQRLPALLVFGLLLIALLRVGDTYASFNHTFDEPAHIGSGMQFLAGANYIYETKHPPMRAVYAIGPMLLGERYSASPDMWKEGARVLYGHGYYFRNLTASRAAALPFFALTVFLVFLWAREISGAWTGVAAALAYTTLPLALAHGGLATTDTLVTCTLTLTLYAWARVLTEPTLRRWAMFGAAAAFAVLSKFSALLFLSVAVPITGAALLLRESSRASEINTSKLVARGLAEGTLMSSLLFALTIWAGYRFSFGPIAAIGPFHQLIDANIFPGDLNTILHALIDIPLPAPEFLMGLGELVSHNHRGHMAFFMGSIQSHGNPAFFPVAFAIKTPIPFVVLSFLGGAVLLHRAWRSADPKALIPPLAALLIFAACIPSSLNIGLRHLLPIFPLLAIAAGVAIAFLWQARNRWTFAGPALATALVSWQTITSARAHPDYLAYFNEYGARAPERFIVDSDLDWGQDLARLSDELRARRIRHLYLAYFGSADPSKHGLPIFEALPPRVPVKGWLAISEWQLAVHGGALDADYAWVRQYRPVTKVGRSIRLYRIP